MPLVIGNYKGADFRIFLKKRICVLSARKTSYEIRKRKTCRHTYGAYYNRCYGRKKNPRNNLKYNDRKKHAEAFERIKKYNE